MTLLSSLLPVSHVKLDIEAPSKAKLFEQAAGLLSQTFSMNPSQIAGSLNEREKLGSTALGQGIAIPHGRVKGLREATGAFIRIRAPLEFGAPDGIPVSLVFVLLVPERANDLHLQILGELATLFSDREVRRQLAGAADERAAQQVIVGWDPNASGQRRPDL
ncbi:MAG: PTS sugar transporter subunit IIA [Betaproteobacteria bacterium]|nr:PTS sugar transporter subunit IIA [Betaproteobacteria bacterium]